MDEASRGLRVPAPGEVPAPPAGLRAADRAAADAVLVRVATGRSRQRGNVSAAAPAALLSAARAAFDTEIAPAAAGAYADYLRALDTPRSAGADGPRRTGAATIIATAAACTALSGLAHGLGGGAALGEGVETAAVATVASVVHSAVTARRAADPDRARRRWLTALEHDGVRPFLARATAAGTVPATAAGPAADAGTGAPTGPGAAAAPDAGPPAPAPAPVPPPPPDAPGPPPADPAPPADPGPAPDPATAPPSAPAATEPPAPATPATAHAPTPDRSAFARRRAQLERSFADLPEPAGPYAGREAHLARIGQWVRRARAASGSRPTVVTLYGPPGSGRSALAVRAARELADQFRGACVVTLRGGAPGEAPLTTREALLHLLNRFGAPREQLLFREAPSGEQHLRRLLEEYQRHLRGLPVIVVLDDASDPEQVRALVPRRSESLVLVTAAAPVELDLPDVWLRELPVGALDEAGTAGLLRELAGPGAAAPDPESVARIRELCAGLPLALRTAGSSLGAAPGARTLPALAADLAAVGAADPVERALTLRYGDQPEPARRLLRRLALAGRASLGAGAAAALLDAEEADTGRLLDTLADAGLIEPVRGHRYRLHDAVRGFARARLLDEEDAAGRTAAQERLLRTYAELADSVLRLVDGASSSRADDAVTRGAVGAHGFRSPEAALAWLDEESGSITATVRAAEGVDAAVAQRLLDALCDYCLLRGDLYRLGELNELTQAVDQGLLTRSVRWRTGIAARHLGDLDRARTTLASVVDLYFEAEHPVGAARALGSLGVTLHHQGRLVEAAAELREALRLQTAPELGGDRAWTLHALGAVLRDQGYLASAVRLLLQALDLHADNGSVRGRAWAHMQLGQAYLRLGQPDEAERELGHAERAYAATGDRRGTAWTLTQLARARLQRGEAGPAVDRLRRALAAHRETEDARGEAWTLYYLGMALEDAGETGQALRTLERARTMFNRMRDLYGLACARHHCGRVIRDQRAAAVGNLRNSGFARQLLQDAREDFRRAGVTHGEAWSCLELAVVDAGNERPAQALELTEEAGRLFARLGDRRGEDWARFLRCTVLPLLSEAGADTARADLAALLADPHEGRDPAVTEYAAAWSVALRRGPAPGGDWAAWRLGMTPSRTARGHLSLRET